MTDREQQEFDEMVGALGAAERSRTIKAVLFGGGLLLVAALVLWVLATSSDEAMHSENGISNGDFERLTVHNNPVCSSMITDIHTASDDFVDHELDFEEGLWADDEEALEELLVVAQQFRARFVEIESRTDDADFYEEPQLNHPSTPEQLAVWFGNMDNEFRILEELADKRLRMLRDEEVEERSGKWEDPESLRDTVLMTIDENFEEFRVWVARGAHPCGVEDDGEDPEL